jgi:hypothetical protein
MNEKAQELIDEFGDQAYWRAVEFTAMANQFADEEGMKMFSEAAITLMELGYHKNSKKAIE